jgi:hypothetical protein
VTKRARDPSIAKFRWAIKIGEAAAETEKTTLKKVTSESIVFLPFEDHGL